MCPANGGKSLPLRTLRCNVVDSTVICEDHLDGNATADLFTQRLEIHEKTAWMRRSLLA